MNNQIIPHVGFHSCETVTVTHVRFRLYNCAFRARNQWSTIRSFQEGSYAWPSRSITSLGRGFVLCRFFAILKWKKTGTAS
jgi:hypothetical protein